MRFCTIDLAVFSSSTVACWEEYSASVYIQTDTSAQIHLQANAQDKKLPTYDSITFPQRSWPSMYTQQYQQTELHCIPLSMSASMTRTHHSTTRWSGQGPSTSSPTPSIYSMRSIRHERLSSTEKGKRQASDFLTVRQIPWQSAPSQHQGQTEAHRLNRSTLRTSIHCAGPPR